MESLQLSILIKCITQYFIKCKQNQWLLQPPYGSSSILNQMVSDIRNLKPPEKLDSISPKIDHNQLVIDNIKHIGKGSGFHRRSIQAELKSLDHSSLERSKDIEEQKSFPVEKSEVIHHMETINPKSMGSQILKALDKELAQEIITKLTEITPKSKDENELSPIAINDYGYKIETHLSNDVYTEVYPIPQFRDDLFKFEQYIHLLTHSTFHYKKSSSFNGIIPKILRNLFHPFNNNTINLRTADSYNHIIHFFSSKWDIATCREYLVQMRLENIKPTTTTYNIMIKNLLTLKNIKHIANPYKIALKHLDSMKRYKLNADVVTWNLIFKLLKDYDSKSSLLEHRSSLNIPLDHHSTKDLIRFLSLEKEMNAVSLINLLKTIELPVDDNILNIMIKKLVSEQEIETAYKLVLISKHKNPPIEPMNILLTHFAKIGRVDLVIGTLNVFKNKFGVTPNVGSYNLVMKSFAQSGQWNQKYEVWRVMYKRMLEDLDNVIVGTYWISRLRSRLKFIYGVKVQLSQPLNEKELKLKEKMERLFFEDNQPLPLIITKETPNSYKDIAKYMGSRNYKSQRKQSSKQMEKKKNSAKSYRKRINTLAIQKAMYKRVAYAKNKSLALKEELESRNLIQ